MNKQQAIAELKARGFTHVDTMAGSLPLDDWDPYGLETTNYSPTSKIRWDGEFIAENRIRDTPREPMTGFFLGAWTFTREAANNEPAA